MSAQAIQTEHDRLADHIKEIAYRISNGIEVTKEDIDDDIYDLEYEIGDIIHATDYLQDALDIRYLVSGDSDETLLKVEILVAFGGPNIWVDIWNDGTGQVRGYWWGDNASASIYSDPMGIFELLQEIRECR